jgi:hypothetical protein
MLLVTRRFIETSPPIAILNNAIVEKIFARYAHFLALRNNALHARLQNIIFSAPTQTCSLAHRVLFRKGKSSAETDGFELGTGELKSRRLGEPLLGLVRVRFPCDGEDLWWTVKKPDHEKRSGMRDRLSDGCLPTDQHG